VRVVRINFVLCSAAMAFSAEKCLKLASKGGDWVAQQLLDTDEDRLPVAFGDWFKAPLALAQCGNTFAGNAVLDRILRRFGGGPSSEGIFEKRAEKSDMSFGNIMYCYRQAVCLTGAAALGRWDVASRTATAAALACQEACGEGLQKAGKDVIGWGHGGIVSATPTAMMGLYLVHRNELQAATKVGNLFVEMLYERQSQASRVGCLYFCWDAQHGHLLTDDYVAEHEELAWFGERRVLRCVDSTCERQHNYLPGLAAAFLAELYAATQESKYIDAAWHLMEFDRQCHVVKHWPSHCKAAWGAANVLRFSPPSERNTNRWASLLVHLQQVTDHSLIANAQASGSFGRFHFPLHDFAVTRVRAGMLHYSDEPDIIVGKHMIIGTELNLSAEFIYELCYVARGLASTAEAGDAPSPKIEPEAKRLRSE